MSLYERYINGETKVVYDDIDKLSFSSLNGSERTDVEKVLKETFERVSYNLNVIYRELVNIGYHFKKDCRFNFEKPLHAPLEHTES